MSAKIKTLFDKVGNKLYPKTKTSAVYDDNNVALDSVITNIENVIEVVDGNGAVKTAINPTSEEIASFSDGAIWLEIPPAPYLTFSSDSAFILSVSSPQWNGTLEYSTDLSTWSTWDGSQLSGDESNPIYLRGIGNTKITGDSNTYKWTFTGKYITGNIENLLDYQTVANGGHPTMYSYCYSYMFKGCTSLVTPPELPATALTYSCYSSMFYDCTFLTTPPELPATTLVTNCYTNMFRNCTSLVTAPELSATTLAEACYVSMFNGCTSLTTPPELPATTLADSCYRNMFSNCSSIKLSTTQDPDIYKYPYRIPTIGTGTTVSNALNSMFNNTGGTFTGTPTINTTYYTDHEPISSNLETTQETTNSTELCIKINNSEKRINLDENVADKLDKYASGSSDWDSTPTQDSTKAITSGGVYQAISDAIGQALTTSY